ncbi:hypothetical protein CCR75_001278 [Bremia lactucae]|uniref:Uncharacterized protein n=1 Tax=Bremia lactucae TaxID=4779 RepID=A0A976IFF3_BRELC|nr:hypothetical protein CCR75_001278 [Bremia lactucae]
MDLSVELELLHEFFRVALATVQIVRLRLQLPITDAEDAERKQQESRDDEKLISFRFTIHSSKVLDLVKTKILFQLLSFHSCGLPKVPTGDTDDAAATSNISSNDEQSEGEARAH